ncbi:MAG: DUF1957 domain-containing protein [Clostridiales bacterium]|nr:DUF1957 domain-containing protein [Clostridiales bacterium]
MANPKGYVSFVLHAHLPFVHHPESEDYLEEKWLFEAMSEVYIPLLENFEKLVEEKVDFRLTMSLTPSLISMLTNKLLQKRYIKYLKQHIELSKKEITRMKDEPHFLDLAKMYYERYSNDLYVFKEKYECNLVNGFKKFQDLGYLEIITCGATHGYFPMLVLNEKTIRAQIQVGVETYEKHLGRKPKGIWLPECGYVKESEKYLKEFGIEYFITESHGILYANPIPIYGTYAPIISDNGLCAFGRDLDTSRQVWSSEIGYPGDVNYREYYRDIGYDCPDYEYIKPYIANNGHRVHTGIKYYRITGKTEDKKPYVPQWARDSAEKQAGHFLDERMKQIEHLSSFMKIPPVILSPYDAELFGHWWYEGPYWLYVLFKKIHFDQNTFKLITPSEYIRKHPVIQKSNPALSSWGANGYSEVWINNKNDWAIRHVTKCGEKMVKLAQKYPNAKGLMKQALNQCARELLLLQSSDWAFIITNDTMVDYAIKRIKDHTGRFNTLYNIKEKNDIDKEFLNDTKKRDNIFPDIDYTMYC